MQGIRTRPQVGDEGGRRVKVTVEGECEGEGEVDTTSLSIMVGF